MTLRNWLVCVFALALGVPVAQFGQVLLPVVGSEELALCGGDACCCRPSGGEQAETKWVGGCSCPHPAPGDAAMPSPGTPWHLHLHEVHVDLPRPGARRVSAHAEVPESLRARPEPPPPRRIA